MAKSVVCPYCDLPAIVEFEGEVILLYSASQRMWHCPPILLHLIESHNFLPSRCADLMRDVCRDQLVLEEGLRTTLRPQIVRLSVSEGKLLPSKMPELFVGALKNAMRAASAKGWVVRARR